jgi:hypothetical protein
MRKFRRSLLPKYRAKSEADPGVNPIRNHMSGRSSKSRGLTW